MTSDDLQPSQDYIMQYTTGQIRLTVCDNTQQATI